MPALHQVHQVQHDHKSYGDVDITVIARTGLGSAADRYLVEVDNLTFDGGDTTPCYSAQTSHNEKSQDQAFPVGITTQRMAEGLLDWSLLK